MKRKERHYLYLHLPAYLRQWLLSAYGDGGDVIFPRSSVEHKIIGLHLRTMPDGEEPRMEEEGDTRIVLPCFAGRDPAVYNWMSPKSVILLEKVIVSRFDVDLWQALVKIQYPDETRQEAVEAWMELNGIETDETNCIAVKQRLRRLRKQYSDRLRQRKHRKKN